MDLWRRKLEPAARAPTHRPVGPCHGVSPRWLLRAADETFHLVARCGDVGQNGNGGHAHNDLLSFVLSCAEPDHRRQWPRRYTAIRGCATVHRSTRAHNTVVVEDEEINPIVPDDLFRLRQRASLPGAMAAGALEHPSCRARRLRAPSSSGAYISRTFVLHHIDATFKIDDELSGSGHCDAETLLHLAPNVIATRDGPSALLVAHPPGQQLRLGWRGPRAELLIDRATRVATVRNIPASSVVYCHSAGPFRSALAGPSLSSDGNHDRRRRLGRLGLFAKRAPGAARRSSCISARPRDDPGRRTRDSASRPHGLHL